MLVHLTGFEYRVNPLFARHVHDDAGRHGLLKAAELHRDAICPDLQFGHQVAAINVGLRDAIDPGRNIMDCHRRAAYRRAGRIRNGAENRASKRLRPARRRAQHYGKNQARECGEGTAPARNPHDLLL